MTDTASLLAALTAEIRKAAGWVEIKTYADLPEQTGLSYVFEYKAGGTWVWDFAVSPKGAWMFRNPDLGGSWKDPNELVDECLRWRYAWVTPPVPS
jgi:hypothetical protein